MIKRNLFFLAVLLLAGACAKTTLLDQTMNSFTATASQDKDDRITITWITNSYYTGYEVIRSTSENGTYIAVSPVLGADTFDDTTTTKGVPFYYKVRGFNSIGIPLFTTEKAVMGIAGSLQFGPPSTLKVSQGESSARVYLRWERVDGAVKYRIYRSSSVDGMYSQIAETAKLEHEDGEGEGGKPMGPGQSFYYQIASVDKDGIPSGNRFPSTGGLKGSTLGGTSGFTSAAGKYTDRIELIWNPVPNALSYEVYRAEDKISLGERITEIKAPAESGSRALAPMSYSDSSVELGKVYYYTIFFKGDGELALVPGEKVKSYLKSAGAPGVPENFTVSQGSDPEFVQLRWDPVSGASLYEVSRSLTADGPWEDLELTVYKDAVTGKMYTKDDPYTDASVESFSYFYRVAAGNPALGSATEGKQGWANRPPANITASKIYGGRIALEWDSIPGVNRYLITYSETANGEYSSAGIASPSGASRETYSHSLPLVTEREKTFYYKIIADTPVGQSFPSKPIEGKISKIVAPENYTVLNNATMSDQVIKMSWDNIPTAKSYRVYRAPLMHRLATVDALKESDYKLLAEIPNNAYQDPLVSYPLRRYVYKILAVDYDGANGEAVCSTNVVSSTDKTVYRLPKDTFEFMKDVDKTIIEAQSRIGGFGDMGSGGNPKGRAGGDYVYAAGTSAVNNWRGFSSFEIVLNGATSFSVNMGDMTADQSGTVSVSGLYSGSVTYNSLKGALGGYTTAGSISVSYAGVNKTYPFGELAELDNIVLKSESKPGYPSYEAGGGGSLQSGWSR